MASILDFAQLACAKPGIEPLTPKWNDAVSTFYSGGFTELWARVGRRGRKSSTSGLVLAYEALNGGHERYLMPGEQGMLVSISKDLSGAETVRNFFKLWLDALGIGYHDSKHGNVPITRIEGTSLVVANLACSSESPRGPAIPVAILDEVAFWETNEVYAQPDTQILAALRPAMAQFPGRKLIGISSPFGKDGVHYNTIERGTHDRTLVVQGPTWEWNPSITEETTRELEPDTKIWSREYAAIPCDTLTDAFDTEDIKAAFRKPDLGLEYCEPVVSADPSSGKNDSFVWAPIRWAKRPAVDGQEQPPVLVVDSVDALDGKFFGTTTLSEIVGRISDRARKCSAASVVSDQREALGLQSEFSKTGIGFHPLDWSNASKSSAVSKLRRLLRERNIILPVGDEVFRKELGKFQQKLLPSGVVTYAARRKGHDDRVALLITALIADTLGLLPGSPLGANTGDGFGAIGIGRGSKLGYADSSTADTDYSRYCRSNGWKYDPIWDN